MRYATLNSGGSFNSFVKTKNNILWDATHNCPASALTPEERALFRVVEVDEGTPPEVNSLTEFVIVNDPVLVSGVWTVQYDIGVRSIKDVQAILKSQTDDQYESRMVGGITYQGMDVQTSDRAVINIIGANRNPNATRKNVIGGRPVEVSGQMAAALEAALTSYTDALGERRYDLYEAINAATNHAALIDIDPSAGWPSNAY